MSVLTVLYFTDPEMEKHYQEYCDPSWKVPEASRESLLNLLHRSIPEGEVKSLRQEFKFKPHPTGGMVRWPPDYGWVAHHVRNCDIATYSNTRADKQEVLAWLYRALELTL